MRIKKFNELFDTDDLKAQHENDYLRGQMTNIIRNMTSIDLKNDDISRLLHRIIREEPFFAAFEDEVTGYGFDSDLYYNEEYDFYLLNVSSDISSEDATAVSLGIKINSINNYNVFVYVDEDSEDYGYDNLTFQQLIQFINTDYKKILIELGLGDLLEYNNSDGTINN